jgi:hypothetical protein
MGFKKGYKWTKSQRKKLLAAMAKRNYDGNNNPNWRGGRRDLGDGRMLVHAPGHKTDSGTFGPHILEYRLIMERHLGRPLRGDEIVHHKNGDVTDNSIGNLEVMTQAQHAAEHIVHRRRCQKTGRLLGEQK